jgi:hypothetical protein
MLRKATLLIASLVIAGFCIYPPWIGRTGSRSPADQFKGYSSVFAPPEGYRVRIALDQLGVQCAVVVVLTLGILLLERLERLGQRHDLNERAEVSESISAPPQ